MGNDNNISSGGADVYLAVAPELAGVTPSYYL